MNFSTFYKESCMCCGTQRCPATEEAAETCQMWVKVKDTPDEEAHETIKKYSESERSFLNLGTTIQVAPSNRMKLEYELSKEDFKDFISAINNGLFLLSRTYHSMKLGVEVPPQFDEMIDKYCFEDLNKLLDKRLKSFQKFYQYLEELEQEERM